MHVRWVLITTLAMITAADAVHGGQRHRHLRTSIDYHLVDHRDIRLLGILEVSQRSVKPRWRAITDIMMRISGRGADVDGILKIPNGQKPHRHRSLFRARFYAVVGGRILHNMAAWCGAWRNHVAVCEADCDGGTFEIRRLLSGSGSAKLDISIARQYGVSGLSDLDGVSLTACDYDRLTDLRLVPARGQAAALIGFTD